MSKEIVRGAMVAIITPFKDGKFDEETYRELIEFQIENGTHAIVPVGTTGESATLNFEEHNYVVKVTVEAVKGRVPVIAGTGANSTQEAIELTKYAKEVGVDACLSVTPYYNKPTQEGLYQHYKAILDEVGLPMVLYNVPGRTSVNLLPETVQRLAELDGIIGIKEASGNIGQVADIINLCGDKINVVSGDDGLVFPILALGGKGVISVVSNIIPKDMADLCDAYLSGDHEKARKLYYGMLKLCKAMFYETNPIPVKTALAMMGKIKEEFRLPLSRMAPPNKVRLKEELKAYGLI